MSDLVRSGRYDDFLAEVKEGIRTAQLRAAAAVTRELLEMGAGFAFVGSQYHLEVGGKDYYLDLLFYQPVSHRCHCGCIVKNAPRSSAVRSTSTISSSERPA